VVYHAPSSRSGEGHVLRPQPNRLVSAVLLLSALMVFGCSEAVEAGAREAITLDFDATTVGELVAVSGLVGLVLWPLVRMG
jgi:hypothetical protein